MWHDNETDIDYINFHFVAKSIAELIQQAAGEPISIGVSGGWGTGKSSLVKMIDLELKKKIEQAANEADKQKYVIITFNPWLYQDFDDAKSALLQVIGEELIKASSSSPTALEKAKKIAKKIDIFRFLKLGTEAAVTIHTGVPVGLIGTAINKSLEASQDNSKLTEAYNASTEALGKDGKGVLNNDNKISLPHEIQSFRDSIEELLESLNIKLIVFVDDLDRCLPPTAIKTLEAMRLLLFLKNSAFIIAADDEVLRAAVSSQLLGAGINDKSAINYFDKLIQVPIRVPHLGVNEVTAYIALLFMEYEVKKHSLLFTKEKFLQSMTSIKDRLSKTWKGKGIDGALLEGLVHSDDLELRSKMILATQLAPLMVISKSIGANPRLIKRFLNTVYLRKSLASGQKIEIDIPVLVKWHLLERCEPVIADYIAKGISIGTEGVFLQMKNAEQSAKLNEELPEGFGSSNFMNEWLCLEPSLIDRDLRPILHLSRDTQIRDFGVDPLNEEGKQLVEHLLIARIVDDALKQQITKVGEEQAILAMERAWIKASTKRTWRIAAELVPLTGVCEVFPNGSTRAQSLLGDVPVKLLGPSWAEGLSRYRWSDAILRKWANDVEASSPLKKSITQTLQGRN